MQPRLNFLLIAAAVAALIVGPAMAAARRRQRGEPTAICLNSAASAALIDHRIDVCCLSEPYLTPALESGKVRSVGPGYSAIADHFALTVYFANADWAAKHANLVKTFLRVAYEAAAYTNAHHAETVAMMSSVTKIPVATLHKIARVDGSTTSDPALIQTTIDLAAKYHNIPRAFPAKEAYFTP